MSMFDMKPKNLHFNGSVLAVSATKFGATIVHVNVKEIDEPVEVIISNRNKPTNTKYWEDALLNRKVSMLCVMTFARSGDDKGNIKFHHYIHLKSVSVGGWDA